MLKKDVAKLFLSTIAATIFAACGDDTTTEKIVEVAGGTVIVESVGDLPECTKDIEGERAWVKTESTDRICVDGKWFATKDSLNAGDFSCTTKELKDKSGIKIVCNGDSIGVVLNGSDGKDGKAGTSGKDGDDGAGCAVVGQTDSTVVVKCGGQTMTLNLGAAAGLDSLGLDSERIAVSLDTLAGVSQKGPFLKGSTVYLYELSDGHTLKQTNGNFVSNITSDDGRFRFTTRNLMSQYALIVVDGKYRNEVTGEPTNTAIRMQAYTDVLNRKNANVNLLTQLEMNRVYNLVTQKKKRFKVAKHQAQMEIFNAFHIDTTVIDKSSEDLNVFGSTEADAALLAISIMLQGDSNETALSVLLTEIADDMESDGQWNDSATRARIADWAATVDSSVSLLKSKLAVFHNNVEGWALDSGDVPYFEKYIRKFWSKELGLGICGEGENRVGLVKRAPNKYSMMHYAESYTDSTNKIRFICDNADLFRWRTATDIEKDTMGWGHEFAEGDIRNGKVNSNKTYVYEGRTWRYGTNVDSIVAKACMQGREDTVAQGSDDKWYKCVNHAWRLAKNIEMDTATWGHDFQTGDYRNGRINNTLTYVYDQGNWRLGTEMDSLLKKGCVKHGDTSTVKHDNLYYVCTAQPSGSEQPLKWVIAPEIYNDTYEARGECSATGLYGDGTILAGRVNSDNKYVCDADSFRRAISTELSWNKGCVSYIRNGSYVLGNQLSHYKCTVNGWQFDIEGSSGTVKDAAGTSYRTIAIKNQVWMAENMNLEYKVNGKTYRNYCNKDNCETYGRYYTWAAAMDSAGVYSTNGKGCGQGKSCTPTSPVRGICPAGWHLPDDREWETLYASVGSDAAAMLATGFEDLPKATDAYGFTALPAGQYLEGGFRDVGKYAEFWSVVEYSDEDANWWYLYQTTAYILNTGKYRGLPVRCVKN
ncbi:MAG: hypothetical protein IKO21_00845 [Fibrobacter sp.]|nr:hypothetical protein [Fibrobacter sp.]